MRVVEHLRQLHPEAGEVVDVEEAAIVDVVGGDAEMRGAPILLLDQRVEVAPAVEAAGLAIEPPDRGRHRVPHIGPFAAERGEFCLELTGAPSDLRPPFGKAREGIAEPLQLGMRVAEDARVVQRADRQLVGVVGPDREAAFLLVEFEDELPRLEHDAVLVAEQGNEELVAEVAAVRVPVDVEPSSMSRIGSPFQHVEPERIVGAADPHMVRHEIQHLLQPVPGERRIHPVERSLIPQLGVERVMIDDVVAVGAARPRLEIGGGIEMADAEPGQVGRQLGGTVEAEILVKLQAIGGAGNDGRHITVFLF